MSEFYIELSQYRRIELDKSEVDLMNTDNNRGYNVYGIALLDSDGLYRHAIYFSSVEARYHFELENDIRVANDYGFGTRFYDGSGTWFYDQNQWFITYDNGSWKEQITCLCDVNMVYQRS